MARIHLQPTRSDKRLAAWLARHANPAIEKPMKILTLAADERLLLACAAGFWFATRASDAERRKQATHILLCTATTAVLPHMLKGFVDQERPDRCMVGKYRHGIPRSGRPYDAFPSGHAMHVGAIASAVARFWPGTAKTAWSLGALLASTRVVLLAHWASDVLAGLAIGAGLEHLDWALLKDRKAPRDDETIGCR